MEEAVFEGCTIYGRKDGTFVVDGYHVCSKDIDPMGKYDIEELKAYLLARPDVLQSEPLPPPPTDAQLEAQAEAQRQARFAEYDTAIMQLRRHERMGDTTATEKIALWDAYAVALQALNDAPGWFRDTVWPVKPEV